MPVHAPRSFTVQWGSESVLVSNVEPELPVATAGADLAKVVEAGRANPVTLLPEAAWQAVARATTSPDGVAVQLRPTAAEPAGLLMVENVDGATLHSVVTRVHLSEMLPGIQPRTGMEVMEIPDPQVQGLTDAGRPCAIVRYRYQDPTHLRNHVWQTIHGTLSLNSYAPSILARKVTRNLIAHPVEITFEDGTESFHGLVVRDGITRLASAWAVLAGPDADAAETAGLAVDSLFGKNAAVPAAQGGGPLGQRLAASREKWRRTLREEFARGIAEQQPGTRTAQIAQTSVLPAQIAVGAEGHPGHLLAAEDIFDDAIRSVLASVHVEFKQWDTAAQNVEVATRALKRVIQLGDSLVPKDDLQTVYGLAVGRIPVEELPRVFAGDTGSEPPGTALWRSVYLVHALTRPELLEPLKDQAKAIKGGKRMGLKGFAELLGPLIDLPWRSHKKHVTTQARNAWNNGGVLTSDVIQEWEPRPTDDFTSLVKPALAGDTDARCTLAVAGGVALIADKLLTRNVGSALMAAKEKGGVPFRADVNQVVEDLSQQHNELGLWTLALAANRFRSDALPENAVTMRQLIHKQKTEGDPGTPYVHFKTDLDSPDRIERDSDGVPVTLYQWDVVWASNPERALKAHPPKAPLVPRPPGPPTGSAPEAAGGGSPEADGSTADGTRDDTDPGTGAPSPDPGGPHAAHLPASQRAVAHRQVLRQSITDARDSLDRLLLLEPEVGNHTPVVPVNVLDELHTLLIGLQTDVENLRRRATREEPVAEDEEAPEEVGA
ncbi:hypothetical protein B7767_16895 [Streptomyces sp. 13-12-16]|uniref:hypothetical protein n=1 Tax=Streptomyces sp. 13-12-16 TaxID=1570823 RepID=UPI000A1EFBE4|nr:hypothetical protein [Streptomyces sp. 13-12-16]OSP42193.1 hypothetical protein B7767_16895 [Streptomyces sp. 13-12-16]